MIARGDEGDRSPALPPVPARAFLERNSTRGAGNEISAYVVPEGHVVSSGRLFFATAYPVSTPLMWGMSKGVWGGWDPDWVVE